jgi:hypothetical protein
MPRAQQVTGIGTIGAADPGIITVQGVAGGTPQPVTIPTPVAVTLPVNAGPVATTGAMAQQTIIPQAAYNATQTSAIIVNTGYTGVYIRFNVTAVPGVQTVTLSVLAAFTGANELLHTAFPATAVIAKQLFVIHPGSTALDYNAAITASRNIAVPGNYAIQVTHSGAGNFTYSVIVIPIP